MPNLLTNPVDLLLQGSAAVDAHVAMSSQRNLDSARPARMSSHLARLRATGDNPVLSERELGRCTNTQHLASGSLRALQRQGDGAGDDLLVDGLGQSVELGGLETVLADGDVVRAGRAAALLVVAPLQFRHAEPARRPERLPLEAPALWRDEKRCRGRTGLDDVRLVRRGSPTLGFRG